MWFTCELGSGTHTLWPQNIWVLRAGNSMWHFIALIAPWRKEEVPENRGRKSLMHLKSVIITYLMISLIWNFLCMARRLTSFKGATENIISLFICIFSVIFLGFNFGCSPRSNSIYLHVTKCLTWLSWTAPTQRHHNGVADIVPGELLLPPFLVFSFSLVEK